MVVVSYVGSYKQICFSVGLFLISGVVTSTFQLQSAKKHIPNQVICGVTSFIKFMKFA